MRRMTLFFFASRFFFHPELVFSSLPHRARGPEPLLSSKVFFFLSSWCFVSGRKTAAQRTKGTLSSQLTNSSPRNDVSLNLFVSITRFFLTRKLGKHVYAY